MKNKTAGFKSSVNSVCLCLKGHQNAEHLPHQNQPDQAGGLWVGQEAGLTVLHG